MSDESFNCATRTIKTVSANLDIIFNFFGNTPGYNSWAHSLRDMFEKHFAFTLYCCLVINSALFFTIRIEIGSSMDRTTINIPVVNRIRVDVTDPILRVMGILIQIFPI